MKKIPISIFCGVILIAITVILYFIILGNIFLEAICLATLVGVVIAEGVTTVLAYTSKGDPRRVAAAAVSAFMVPVALLLSVVYIVNFPNGYVTYAGWYVACYLVVAIVVVVLLKFQSTRAVQDASFQNAKNQMLGMRKIVKCIMADSAAEQYKKQLHDIEEKLHFTNDGVIDEQDGEIRRMLIEFQEKVADPEFDAFSCLERINKAIDRRNIMTNRTV